MSFTRQYALRDQPLTRDQTRGVFGQVMGLVALTVGCTALGAYITRNATGGTGILFFLAAFACIFGLRLRHRPRAGAVGDRLLFGLGLAIGMAVGPVLHYYAKAEPNVLYQAAGATALFTAGLGAHGYPASDLSLGTRLFWALVRFADRAELIALFVAIAGGGAAGGARPVGVRGSPVFDFDPPAPTATMGGAVPIAASIFLDVFNIFLFFLSLFGGGGSRR